LTLTPANVDVAVIVFVLLEDVIVLVDAAHAISFFSSSSSFDLLFFCQCQSKDKNKLINRDQYMF